MPTLTLADLPEPPAGRMGWPWTHAPAPPSPPRPDDSPWPRITIVTPSYNQGQYIEETIRSILLQGYPNLEYIIMDGGSSDETVGIIRRYEKWITHWESTPDNGQADAINKGLKLATGSWFQFINSDDVLAPMALRRIGPATRNADAVAGWVENFGTEEGTVLKNRRMSASSLIRFHGLSLLCDFHQPGVFLRTTPLRDIGGFPTHLRYAFDFAGYTHYLASNRRIAHVDAVLTRFRTHPQSKSVDEGQGFGAEFWLGREYLTDRCLTGRHLRLCEAVVRRNAMPQSVKALRASSRTKLEYVGGLVNLTVREPRAYANRFMLGAIYKALKTPYASFAETDRHS
jgi:glycosyltransferase involved in cell wall biosynthesis